MRRLALLLALAAASGTACVTGEVEDTTRDPGPTLTGAPEPDDAAPPPPCTTGPTLRATANVNLHRDASSTSPILHVIPKDSTVTLLDTIVRGPWRHVQHAGAEGYAHGDSLECTVPGDIGDPGTDPPVPDAGADAGDGGVNDSGPSDAGGPVSSLRDAAIARAKSGLGYSYWWGHGRWQHEAPTAATKGSCSGSCPGCTHTGGNGADCSGYVAKIWQVPASNTDITVDSHPYSTANFVVAGTNWSIISRGIVKPADALVYRLDGAGHVFLYESGDGWGSMWAYEAKGCATGIVHDLRTASSSYVAIQRKGY